MIDTTHLEYTAEDLIAHKLQKNDFLVAKPKFDRDGTDLIILLSVKDGAKLGRVQCKGRSLINSSKTNVKIPVEYVLGAFFVFLYLDSGDDKTHLFVFLTKDIKQWSKYNKNYVLNINKKWFNGKSLNKLSPFSFNQDTLNKMKAIIKKTPSVMEKKLFSIIKDQQKLNKVTKLVTALKVNKLKRENIEYQKKLLDGDINNNKKRAQDILNELIGKIPTDIINYIKKLKNDNFTENETISTVLKKYKKTYKSKDELGLVVKVVYGKFYKEFKIKL